VFLICYGGPLEKRVEAMLAEVLARVTPTASEKRKEFELARRIINKIKKAKGKHVDVMLCGSVARDTHLRNERDFDIFVLFEESLSREEFEKEGLRIGKRVFAGHEYWIEYSEHPYVKGIIESYEIEIVPSYKVSRASKLKSSVDRSPFHARFLKKHLKKEHKKEVRLLKAFVKGIGCYGADIANEGFAGYLIELLILKYGSFIECIKNASKWKPGIKIALKDSHLKKCKCDNPLVFPDPTDPKRNVASALSLEQFARFVAACRAFLEKPSIDFFFPKKTKLMGLERIKKELGKRSVIVIEIPKKEKIAKDIIYGQLKRFRSFCEAELAKLGFKLLNIRIAELADKYCYFTELESTELSELVKVLGPPVFDEKNCKAFIEKHRKAVSGPRIENDLLVVVEKRKIRKAKDAMKKLTRFISLRGKEPIKSMLKKAKILEAKQIIANCKDVEFARALTEFLKARERFF